jgi:hypothetical protein
MNGGAYHWFVYDEKKNVLRTLYFGFGSNLLESLRFLSLPTHYAVGVVSNKNPRAAEADYNKKAISELNESQRGYVNTINEAFKAFDEVYLNFIELDKDGELGRSEHAEAVCITHMLTLAKGSIERRYYLNERNEASKINKKFHNYDYNYYIKKTKQDILTKNYLVFDRVQFEGLVEKIQSTGEFQNSLKQAVNSNLNANKSVARQVDFLMSTFLKSSHMLGSISRTYNPLVEYLTNINIVNKTSFRNLPSQK